MAPYIRHLSANTVALLAFVFAALFWTAVAFGAALVIEVRTEKVVGTRLAEAGIDWVSLRADGLQLHLIGTAPNEAARFRTVNMIGTLIDSARLRDALEVTPARPVQAPDFSVQMLRTEEGIQLIGLVPATPGEGVLTKAQLAEAAGQITPGVEVQNFLETANYPAPPTWGLALNFGLAALERLERSKISVRAAVVEVTAISDSEVQKRNFEEELRNLFPEGVRVLMDISAPRPVITPFTLRFVADDQGMRFDSCSADSERARRLILAAGANAGATEPIVCTIGLGTPTPRWAEAVTLGIRAVAELGAATITFSDADVTLLAASTVPQSAFDKVVGELETRLPAVFSLTSTLEKETSAPQGPAEFTATLSEDDRVELRGRLTDSMQRSAVDAFARAAFEGAEVLTATRVDETLPEGWPIRVLAGLAALAEVEYGSVLVRADTVVVTGVTGSLEARRRITQILSGRLGPGQTFRVDVRYDEALDPIASLPTPAECVAQVNAVIAETKITFTPASAELTIEARPVLDALAAILVTCPPMQMEIAGHTDSQGSEGGNKALSQARAEAVLLALQGRRVDTSGMNAVGYGEAVPIADNETEAGREANRRIEFVPLGAPVPQALGGGAGADARREGTLILAPMPEATEEFPNSPVADGDNPIRPRPRPDGLVPEDSP